MYYGRISTVQQDIEPQIAKPVDDLKEHGFEVIMVVRDVAAGWSSRPKLQEAARVAKAAGAILVAHSTCRLIRRFIHEKERRAGINSHATVSEFEKLVKDLGGVQMATMLHPDTSPNDVRSAQSKRGQNASGNRGGGRQPGWKKMRKNSNIRTALEWRAKGKSYTEISKILKIPRSTIRDWLKCNREQEI